MHCAEISIELVDAKLISLVACLTLHLYTLLKQQGLKNQALLKSQVLIDQEGFCSSSNDCAFQLAHAFSFAIQISVCNF